MTRLTPRRISAPVAAALVCAAVALLSYLALVAYESTDHTVFWH
jgi:hypothetical protein